MVTEGTRSPRLPWLFIDVDGTLVAPGREISPRNAAAVRAYSAAGGRVSLSTGRHPLAIRKLAEQLTLATPQISGNGSVVTEKGRDRLLAGIADYQAEAGRALLAMEMPHIHYTVSGLYIQSPDVLQTHVDLLVGVFHDYKPVWGPPPDPETLFKFILFVDAGDPVWEPRMRGLAEELGLRAVRSSRPFLELISRDAGKGEALVALSREAGWPLEETVAIGDSENDLSMLRRAGHAVAVDNALPEVRLAAQRLIPACADDGVAVFIEDLL